MRSGRLVARGAATNDDWRAGNRHCAGAAGRAGAPMDLDELGRDLVDEAAARVHLHVAVHAPAQRVREHQPLHRARHADVAEAALLLDVGVVDARVREEPFFHADHEHHRELEPLGGVQGHQRHAVGVAVPGVDVADQRHLLEVVLQRPAHRRRLLHALEELVEVLQPIARLGAPVLAQHRPVAALLDQPRGQLRIRHLGEARAEPLDHRGEGAHVLALLRLEELALQRQSAGGEQAARLLVERRDGARRCRARCRAPAC